MRLSANAVKLAYAFAATDDIRYYLNAVHVEPHPTGGAAITGCNGHRLIQVHDSEATDVENMIVNLDKTARAALKKGKYVVTEFEPKKLAVVHSNLTPIYVQWEAYQVEAKFPDVKSVLDERESWVAGLHGTFNVNYVRDCTTAAADALGIGRYDKFSGVSFYSKKAIDASSGSIGDKILFIVDGRTPAWGVVMGMRGENADPLKVAYPERKAA